MIHRISYRMSVLSLGVAAVAACAKGDSAADSARKADSAAAAAAPAAAPAMAAPAMTDANILAMADFANRADSADGSMSASKGTSAAVKEFGRMMMKDHHQMHEEGMALTKKVGITPVFANQADSAEAMAAMETGKSTPAGAAWDKWYIDNAIKDHEKVLAWAQSAANTTQNADIKAGLEKHAPIIQKHLDKAKEIQGKLPAAP